jgi:predicted dehydrogenase
MVTLDVVLPGTDARVRIGMVGSGFMAATHTRAARAAGAELVALVSSSAASAQEAAGTWGYARIHADVEELVSAPDIDLVHICSPNSTHLPIALAALSAGKHVVCEKPLAMTGATAAQLAAAAAASGSVATVPFVYRFHPMVREARERVRRGDLGELLTIQGSYLQDWLLDESDDNWRVDAGVGGPSRAFADIGSHLVDLLEFISDDRITRLTAVKRIAHGHRGDHQKVTTEDSVALAFEGTTRAIGTLLISQVAPGRKNHLTLELSGTRESIRFEQERPDELWLGRRTGATLLPRDPNRLAPEAARLSTLPAGHPLGYQDAFNAFVVDTYSALHGPAPDGLPTFADGLRAARITEAVLVSAEQGCWVEPGGVSIP